MQEYKSKLRDHSDHARRVHADMERLGELLEQQEEEALRCSSKVDHLVRYIRMTPATAETVAVQLWLAICGFAAAVLSLVLGKDFLQLGVSKIRRAEARRMDTTDANDFLGLMEADLPNQIGIWSDFGAELKDAEGAFGTPADASMPGQPFDSEELLQQADGSLANHVRVVGTDKIGMLAWHVTMQTPENPGGREMVVIADDVTFQSGSFGVKEDEFFQAASEYTRNLGLPGVYVSSNSGICIGPGEELKPKFKVAWNDASDPVQGFKYLYLTANDYEALEEGTVSVHEVVADKRKQYALTDVIGKVHGVGVENLRGSSVLVDETSRACDEAFTLTYITGHSVGISAYLVRLGPRTIHMRNGPIILTGFSALNKLFGGEVYTSQDQLGGPQVMHPNGVSHMEVGNYREGVDRNLQWLFYAPTTASPVLPARPVTDRIGREIAVYSTKAPYHPRDLCRGKVGSDGSSRVTGFFDRGFYQECLSGWGNSVVVVRARIGGIPMCVINVETRLFEQIIPADAANPDSREVIQAQAGQVWFPDSAYKMAQAINDFNHGENLPFIIFANWHGFSGGTDDMNGPIVLTGFSALNKLLGREVYRSQDQLGGPQVMHPDGVSHMEVGNGQERVDRNLQWLSYVRKTATSVPPARPVAHLIEREITVYPTKAPYDPGDLCRGKVGSDGSSWVSGFFDRESYQEHLSGWGKSVVVGRARIGGIPMGVINVETRLSEQVIPADPANPDSQEVIRAQAGQVWFPDSAYKTAQAINDFNHENLPLMIFPNWRGFSGGMHDMYGEIMKFGAQIVDALVSYKHPVFVYIPPDGERRGGAWVVIGPTINEEMMEMYADSESRGGILEPPGTCEVKFRAADQATKMHELDPVLQGLDADMKVTASEEDEQALRKQIKSREDALLPMYLQSPTPSASDSEAARPKPVAIAKASAGAARGQAPAFLGAQEAPSPGSPPSSPQAEANLCGPPAGVPPAAEDARLSVGSSVADTTGRSSSDGAVETTELHYSGRTTAKTTCGIGEALHPPLPAQLRSASSPRSASGPSASAKVVGPPTVAPPKPSTAGITKLSKVRKGARTKAELDPAAQERRARRQEKIDARAARRQKTVWVGAKEAGSRGSLDTPPPSLEAGKKPASAPAEIPPSKGDSLPALTPRVSGVAGLTASGAAVEAMGRHASGGTAAATTAPGAGKHALSGTPEAIPPSVGIDNPRDSNLCALIAVLHLFRHWPSVVGLAIDADDRRPNSEKEFSEDALKTLSRKERHRQMAAKRPPRTIMAVLGSFFKAVNKKSAGDFATVNPSIRSFLLQTDGLQNRQQVDAPELLGELLYKVAAEVEADETGVLRPLLGEIRGETSTISTCDCGSVGKPAPVPVLAPFHLLPLAMTSAGVPGHKSADKGKPQAHSVGGLLREHFAQEDGLQACDGCNGGEHKENKTKRATTLSKAPRKLFLHLLRLAFDRNTGVRKKLDHPVEMPHVLDVGPFMSGHAGQFLYDLDGIVHHRSSKCDPDRGHYSTFVRVEHDSWRWYNDKSVTTVRMNDAIAAGSVIISYTLRR